MKINIKAKDFTLTDDIRSEAEKKFDRLDKYFHDEQDMDVRFSKEGNEFVVEATVFLDGGTILRAESSDESYQNAIDRTIDALMRQVRKYKTRLKRNRYNGDSIKFDLFEEEPEKDENDDIKIVRHKEIAVKPMSSEEAVMQMELLNHNFFVYQDADDMEVRVVYKRKNGDYGEIIPTH